MESQQLQFYQTSEVYLKMLSKGDIEYFKEYLDFVRYYLPSGHSLLDAGCGLGQSTSYLMNLGYRVTGIDGTPRFIKKAKESFPQLNFKLEDLEKLSYVDYSFEAVATYNTLEHVSDVEKVLKEIVRVVKPGGLILIHSPNLFSPKHIIDAYIKHQGMTFEGKKNSLNLGILFFRNIFNIFFRRLFSFFYFKYRNPNYDFNFPDNDATVFLNPVDIQLCLKKLGCKIVNYQQVDHLVTNSFFKKIASRFLGDYMSIIRIVAIKEKL